MLELLIASLLATVVIIAIGKLDITRISLTKEVSSTTTLQAAAERLVFHLARNLEQADRINLITLTPVNIQIRIPTPNTNDTVTPCCCVDDGGVCLGTVAPAPCCFDMAQNYTWVQYLNEDTDGDTVFETVRFFDDTANGCLNVRVLAQTIDSLTLTFIDAESLAPPGGEPFDDGTCAPNCPDNNVISVEVSDTDPVTGPITASSDVTIRAGAYTNVNAAAPGDSGTGLEAPTGGPGVSPPPFPPCS